MYKAMYLFHTLHNRIPVDVVGEQVLVNVSKRLTPVRRAKATAAFDHYWAENKRSWVVCIYVSNRRSILLVSTIEIDFDALLVTRARAKSACYS